MAKQMPAFGRPRIVSTSTPQSIVARGEGLRHAGVPPVNPAVAPASASAQTIPALAQNLQALAPSVSAVQNPPSGSSPSVASTIPALAQSLRTFQQPAFQPLATSEPQTPIPAIAQALREEEAKQAAQQAANALANQQLPTTQAAQLTPKSISPVRLVPRVLSVSDKKPGGYSQIVAHARRERLDAAEQFAEAASRDLLPMQSSPRETMQAANAESPAQQNKSGEKPWNFKNASYRIKGALFKALGKSE